MKDKTDIQYNPCKTRIHREFESMVKFKSNQRSTTWVGDFPGGPVVKTLPSNAEGTYSVPHWGAGIPHASQPENKNNSGASLEGPFIKLPFMANTAVKLQAVDLLAHVS